MRETEVIKEHSCSILNSAKDINIAKRYISGSEGWYLEFERKGKIEANGIKFCPYCGEELK